MSQITVAYRVLGVLEVLDGGGEEIRVSASRQRTLLAYLLTRPGAVVSRDALIDALWAGELPNDPRNAVQHYVARLRRLLGAAAVVTSGEGYVLDLGDGSIDAIEFEAAIRHAAEVLDAGDAPGSLRNLDAALSLWRGEPYAEFADTPFAAVERSRLIASKELAQDLRFDALLAVRPGAELVPGLVEAVTSTPTSERRWGQLMRAQYWSGRQADALASYQRARRYFTDELGLELGEELRDLELRILRHDPSLEAPGALAAATAAGRSLSIQRPEPPRNSFVGRADALDHVDVLLSQGRLVTIRGPVGVGKSRLALEWAAAAAAGELPVAVADVESTHEAGLVPLAVAAASGVSEDPASQPIDRLVEQLRRRSLVLVLDGCDAVLEAVRHCVDRLLADCPGVRVLCTCQQALGLPDEAQFALGGLASATTAGNGDAHGAGVRLFIERALAHGGVLEIDDGECETIAEIVDAVDGLPFAIELAAARTRSTSLVEIRAGITAGRDTLEATDGGRQERHSSLMSAIAWTVSLLPAARRTALAELTVLPGPYLVETATAVVGDEPDEVTAHLEDLVGRALVRAHHTPERTVLTTSAIARRHLQARPSTRVRAAAQRMIDHSVDLTVSIDHGLRGPEQLEWLRRATIESENLRHACHIALDERPSSAVRIAVGLSRYWDWRGSVAEANATLATVLALPDDVSAPDRIRALTWAGFFAWEGGEQGRAAQLMEAAVGLLPGGDDGSLAAIALACRGLVAPRDGFNEDSAEDLRAALAHAERSGQRWWAAWISTSLVSRVLALGDDTEAAVLARQALDGFRRLGDRRGMGWALLTRAAVLEDRGRRVDAHAAAVEAVLSARSVDDPRTVAAATELLARLEHDGGALARAAALFAAVDAMQLARGAPDPPSKDLTHIERLLDLEDRLGHKRFAVAWEWGTTTDVADLFRKAGHSDATAD